MDTLIGAISNAGGYAALLALFGILVYSIVRDLQNKQADRAREREKEGEERHHADMVRSDEAMQRERTNADGHRLMTDRVIRVVESNTEVMASNTLMMGAVVDGQRRQDNVLNRLDFQLGTAGRASRKSLPKVPKVNGEGGQING